ncbi:phnA protein [Candidatus Entotheonella serta]|nr:phnA protein [Candidatus Entotheonella serta]
MAKGFDKHRERLEALELFGKDLTRRAASKCELCETYNVKLQIHEVPPVPAEPELESCIFICNVCKDDIEKLGRKSAKDLDRDHWRCLNTSAWSEVPAVQVMAVYLLKQLGDTNWASDLIDSLYVAPEIEDWLEAIKS